MSPLWWEKKTKLHMDEVKSIKKRHHAGEKEVAQQPTHPEGGTHMEWKNLIHARSRRTGNQEKWE